MRLDYKMLLKSPLPFFLTGWIHCECVGVLSFVRKLKIGRLLDLHFFAASYLCQVRKILEVVLCLARWSIGDFYRSAWCILTRRVV